MNKTTKIFYFIVLGLIILVSFFLYSSRFYALLNSDDALNILMAHYYKLPNDIYCWGQDRGGTIIPLISQFFIMVFNTSAIWAVSFSNYLILIVAYFCFSGMFKTTYSKIVFALIWFLPFQRFVDLLRFPIGVQYSFIAIAIFLIIRLNKNSNLSKIKKTFMYALLSLIYLLSTWISDMSSVSFVVLLIVMWVNNYMQSKRIKIDVPIVLWLVFTLLSTYLIISYAKSFSMSKAEQYLQFNSITQIGQAASMLFNYISSILLFKTREIHISLFVYLLIVFIFTFIFYILKHKLSRKLFADKWVLFFFIDFMIVLGVLLLSSWVLANGMGRWYFVASYISLSLFLVLSLENIDQLGFKVGVFKIFLVLIVILSAISPVLSMKFVNPRTLKPRADVVKELDALGEIGIIGEYWNAYINSVSNPEKIKAIPHDDVHPVRNFALIEDVFNLQKIYIVGDMWLENFPDTLYQYGRCLIKEGAPFNIADSRMCKYKVL